MFRHSQVPEPNSALAEFVVEGPILLLLFLLSAPLTAATPYFEWTPTARAAYEKVIQLRFREGNNLLQRLETEEPDNYIRLHIANYRDFFTVYINEDQDEFQRLEANKEERLRLIRTADQSSPYYLYLQADIRLHWALARLKFEEYPTAFFEVNKAYKLLKQNEARFPDFVPNRKDLGILHAVVGTIPDNYKWGVELLSALEGDFAQGRRELEEVIAYAQHNDFIFEEEIYVLYAYLMLHLGKNDEAAWKVINESSLDPQVSPMACFIQANIAMRTGRNDEAVRLLQNRPSGRVFHPFPYLDFMLGVALMRRLDPAAEAALLRFTRNFGGRNFIKEAYQRLAWIALLDDRPEAYDRYMQLVKWKGYTVVSTDESALRNALDGVKPHPELLRARMLFDGGYHQRAYERLAAIDRTALPTERLRVEALYRTGRALQELRQYPEALTIYEQVIAEGSALPWYYACRAAIERGHIYEAMGQRQSARRAFERALAIKPDEHKTGLHQMAKAGVGRVR